MTSHRRPGALTEKQFSGQVLALAALRKWACYHTFDSRRSQPGFPDLVLVRPPRLIFAELKTDTGRVTPVQTAWLERLAAAHDEVHLWRPAQWDEIEEVLA